MPNDDKSGLKTTYLQTLMTKIHLPLFFCFPTSFSLSVVFSFFYSIEVVEIVVMVIARHPFFT